ncbi:MAG TPA: IPT/TIG domain-containing protein [Trebonia sp.]
MTGVSPATGLDIGGDPVTITGTNLADATAVTFGPGNDATNVYCTATSCTVASAPGADGTVDVQVTTDVASATSSADQFTYLPVISIAGPSGPVQAGTPYTYTVTVPEAPLEFGNPQATVTTTLSGAAAAFTAVTANGGSATTCT